MNLIKNIRGEAVLLLMGFMIVSFLGIGHTVRSMEKKVAADNHERDYHADQRKARLEKEKLAKTAQGHLVN